MANSNDVTKAWKQMLDAAGDFAKELLDVIPTEGFKFDDHGNYTHSSTNKDPLVTANGVKISQVLHDDDWAREHSIDGLDAFTTWGLGTDDHLYWRGIITDLHHPVHWCKIGDTVCRVPIDFETMKRLVKTFEEDIL